MDIHPAELALEALPAVPLHDLAADVARGDVLEGVLCKLVVGLKDRGRLHLDIKISNFKNQNDSRDQLDHSVHLLNIKIKTRRKKDNYFNSDTRRASFLDDH